MTYGFILPSSGMKGMCHHVQPLECETFGSFCECLFFTLSFKRISSSGRLSVKGKKEAVTEASDPNT